MLIEEAIAVGFPLEELALSLAMHQAPRRLKMGKSMGEVIAVLGRAILAGCKRSTQLARAYTLRMVRKLNANHPAIDLYQHVDDMTNLVKGSSESNIVEETVSYIRDFAAEASRLKIEISEKSTILPANKFTKRICRIANREGIQLSVAASGVDIGVDTAAGSRRTTKQQRKRIQTARRRAKRALVIAKADKRARKLATTNIKPCGNSE